MSEEQKRLLEALQVGAICYYSGDLANREGICRVKSLAGTSSFGRVYFLEFKDGREWQLRVWDFEKSPGQRFYLLNEWLEKKALGMEALARALEPVSPENATAYRTKAQEMRQTAHSTAWETWE